MKITDEQLLELLQYAFVRMDGAWFMGMAKKHGIDEAWEMDKAAWNQFSYVLGKKIKNDYFPEPVWPQSFLEMIDIYSRMLKIEGREVVLDGDSVIVRATECETQKAIAKAGIADCGIVTVETFQNMIRALFGDDLKVDVVHTKNLNRGADCCEVVVTRI